MSADTWLVWHTDCSTVTAEVVSEALIASGFIAFTQCHLGNATAPTELTLYGANGTLPASVQDILAQAGLQGSQELVSEAVLLQGMQPDASFCLTEGVWIHPPGTASTEHELDIEIPLGAAWGDGRHPTTKMLADWINRTDLSGKHVLDLGCGTGLLSLLAHHRGAADILASDIDETAVLVSQALLAAHHAQATIIVSDLLQDLDRRQAPVDLIIANIYADLSWRLCQDPGLSAWLSPRGTLLLSGISSRHYEHTMTVWQDTGWTVTRHHQNGWWHALQLHRHISSHEN